MDACMKYGHGPRLPVVAYIIIILIYVDIWEYVHSLQRVQCNGGLGGFPLYSFYSPPPFYSHASSSSTGAAAYSEKCRVEDRITGFIPVRPLKLPPLHGPILRSRCQEVVSSIARHHLDDRRDRRVGLDVDVDHVQLLPAKHLVQELEVRQHGQAELEARVRGRVLDAVVRG